MSIMVRTKIPMLIAVILGLMMLSDYYLEVPPDYHALVKDVKNIATAIAAFALGVGAIGLFTRNAVLISKRKEGWTYGAWTLITMISFLIIGLSYGTGSSIYNWLFMNVYSNINQAMYSLTAFYIVISVYRGFLIRTWETAIMFTMCIFVLMGRAPIGEWLWSGFAAIFKLQGDYLAVGAITAFNITIAIGAIMFAIRILSGREKASLG